MKISNSKKELARIISENGGWRDGCDFAVQDKDSWVCLYEGRPTRCGNKWVDNGDCQYRFGFAQDNTPPNWHQTILSRAEYFRLYPATDADGWIECDGNFPRVSEDSRVDVKDRVGRVETETACYVDWDHSGGECDIIAYRLHKPEQSESEFCESVMRSIPEPEANPTIEQLAVDYRNKLDFANRKQQEADDAKVEADAALGELERADEVLGLVIGIPKMEPVTAKFTGKFHSAKYGDRPSHLDMICDGCGKRFGHHVGFECRP